ncbi:MAG: phage head-tail connector protein [Proteobacteria bacterium]|nr:phage head-tail connector protein [Pseudomonadota bacterium]
MNLTTLAKVKTLLELSETDWDGLINELIGAVSERCASYCNRDFENKSRVEYQDGGGRYLYLRGLPVVGSISSIYGSDTWEWSSGDLIDAGEYYLHASGMVGYRYGAWPYGPKALKVTYTRGYFVFDAGPKPPEGYNPPPDGLEMAARTQVAYDFNRRKDVGLESVSFPDGTIQKVSSGEFLPSVKAVLNRYRIRPHG